jgi:N-acyl-L-homoserine lactone synthetase
VYRLDEVEVRTFTGCSNLGSPSTIGSDRIAVNVRTACVRQMSVWRSSVGLAIAPSFAELHVFPRNTSRRVGRVIVRWSSEGLAEKLLPISDRVNTLEEIQRLRYDVYCNECGFLDGSNFPDEREQDDYDAVSVHCAVSDATGKVAGTARLVCDSGLGFPLEAHARRLDPVFYALPRGRTAEISRLVVAKSSRGYLGESRPDPGVLFALFRELNRESAGLGLRYWIAAMEPTLSRLLRRLLRIDMVLIGEPMDYYGEVLPYLVPIEDAARRFRRTRPDLFSYFGFDLY